MIDKALVKRRFKKSLPTYSENAVIQKEMAQKLIKMLPSMKYDNVFEIGCATGTLTEQIIKNIEYKTLDINDIVADSKNYIDKLVNDYRFISGDIEAINLTKKYDLIISNACLQWCNDIKQTAKKLINALNTNGILAISIFGYDNLKEINDIFDIQQKCYTKDDLYSIFKSNKDIKTEEETIKIYFDSAIDILQHLKLTGANAVKEYKFTKSALKTFEQTYNEKYSSEKKVYLTYNPIYCIVRV